MLGLIFLRHAFNRFQAVLPEVESGLNARLTSHVREERIRMGFKGKAAIYLPSDARWDHLASLPEGSKVGEALRHAMNLNEDSVEDGEGKKVLAGALPREYLGFEPALLPELVKIFNRPSLAKASGDVFGRIYEYFLNQFALIFGTATLRGPHPQITRNGCLFLSGSQRKITAAGLESCSSELLPVGTTSRPRLAISRCLSNRRVPTKA